MFLTILLMSILAGALNGIPLGPLAILAVNRYWSQGLKAALPITLGTIVGDGIYALLALLLDRQIEDFFTRLEDYGPILLGAVLIAVGMFLRRHKINSNSTQPAWRQQAGLFITALTVTLMHPGNFAGFVAAFAVIDTPDFRTRLVSYLGIIMGEVAVWSALFVLARRFKKTAAVKVLQRLSYYLGNALITGGMLLLVYAFFMPHAG
jgi:threonine/homoserine/homoserine lactone efflux protein